MNLFRAERIANAVLYEGYILYPYRPSAVKNRQRWTFGGVYPRAYAEAQSGADLWSTQTQCLIAGNADTMLDVRVRFLHLQDRTVGESPAPVKFPPEDSSISALGFRIVESLRVGQKVFHSWQESVEREVMVTGLNLGDLSGQPHQVDFAFAPGSETELLRDAAKENMVVGVIERQQYAISGAVAVAAEPVGEQGFKVTVRVTNLTPFEAAAPPTRDPALLRSFVSTHAILAVQGGEFLSLLDPPEPWREAAAGCRNVGVYPVLVGDEGERDLMLASPIILYDYPQLAPESAGDLFDGTEIDEILTLRILTLTDAEKQEVRQSDERAREMLDRTEALPWEQLLKLHGVVRSIRPLEEPVEEA